MFVCLLDKYIIGCPSCDNILDIECSLASVVNVLSFFGSKIFSTSFFVMITFNLSKAFYRFSDQIISTFFFLKFANCSVKSVYFGTYRLWKFTPAKLKFFLFVGVVIFSIFSIKAWSGDIPKNDIFYYYLCLF